VIGDEFALERSASALGPRERSVKARSPIADASLIALEQPLGMFREGEAHAEPCSYASSRSGLFQK
jgi:hypothetical protein